MIQGWIGLQTNAFRYSSSRFYPVEIGIDSMVKSPNELFRINDELEGSLAMIQLDASEPLMGSVLGNSIKNRFVIGCGCQGSLNNRYRYRFH